MDDFNLQIQFLLEADERDHDFRLALDAFLLHKRRSFENCARLHLGNFRKEFPPTTAMAEHWVELVQLMTRFEICRR